MCGKGAFVGRSTKMLLATVVSCWQRWFIFQHWFWKACNKLCSPAAGWLEMLSCVVLEGTDKWHIRLFNLEDLSGVCCCGTALGLRSTSATFSTHRAFLAVCHREDLATSLWNKCSKGSNWVCRSVIPSHAGLFVSCGHVKGQTLPLWPFLILPASTRRYPS